MKVGRRDAEMELKAMPEMKSERSICCVSVRQTNNPNKWYRREVIGFFENGTKILLVNRQWPQRDCFLSKSAFNFPRALSKPL